MIRYINANKENIFFEKKGIVNFKIKYNIKTEETWKSFKKGIKFISEKLGFLNNIFNKKLKLNLTWHCNTITNNLMHY